MPASSPPNRHPLADDRDPAIPRPPLAPDGDDRAIRALLADIAALADRLTWIRAAVGRTGGFRALDFEVLRAIGEFTDDTGRPPARRDLAERLDVHPVSVQNAVACLFRKGLVVRRHDPVDGRRTRLDLTDAGRTALAELLPALRGATGFLSAALSFDDFVALRRIVPRLRADAERALEIVNRRAGLDRPGAIGGLRLKARRMRRRWP